MLILGVLYNQYNILYSKKSWQQYCEAPTHIASVAKKQTVIGAGNQLIFSFFYRPRPLPRNGANRIENWSTHFNEFKLESSSFSIARDLSPAWF